MNSDALNHVASALRDLDQSLAAIRKVTAGAAHVVERVVESETPAQVKDFMKAAPKPDPVFDQAFTQEAARAETNAEQQPKATHAAYVDGVAERESANREAIKQAIADELGIPVSQIIDLSQVKPEDRQATLNQAVKERKAQLAGTGWIDTKSDKLAVDVTTVPLVEDDPAVFDAAGRGWSDCCEKPHRSVTRTTYVYDLDPHNPDRRIIQETVEEFQLNAHGQIVAHE